MNTKSFLCLALLAWSPLSDGVAQRPPAPPSAEQVRLWAGLPKDCPLQRVAQPTTNAAAAAWGKPLWIYHYANRQRSLVSFNIMLCQAGALWGTNHTRLPQLIQEQVSKLPALTNGPARPQAIQVRTLPNGRKAYFMVLGFGPGGTGLGGFTYGPAFDLLVTEDDDAEDDVPPEQKVKNPAAPTQALPVLFEKVHAFLATP